MTTPSISPPQLSNDANNNNNNSSSGQSKTTRRQKSDERIAQEEEERKFPRFVFDPDSALVCYWTAAVALVTLYNAWTIALRIAFPEMRVMNDQSYLPIIDVLCDLVYVLDIIMQLRTAYLQDGIPVFDPQKIRQNYLSQTYFIQDVICVLPSHTLLSLLPDGFEFYKYFLCSAGAARLTKLLKFHILYKFYDLAESFTSNPHLIRVLRLFLNLTIIIHWIACLYYLLSEYEGLGSNDWVYTNATDQQRFSRKYLKCLYWSAMTLTTIGDTNTPETDLEYIFTGVIFLTGVFVFATVMGNVGDVISSMNANRQEFQARMDHIQMYLTHKKVPASLQLKIKKWAEYTWSRTKATDESRLLNMLPERLRAEVAVHVHLDSLKKVKIFEQCETGFLCELVLKLRSQVFSPGDYVCRVGETGREMFIINHGKVEVVVNNPATFKPMVVAVLSEGNYFGEISLLRLDGVQNRRTADVRSIGYSELLCLSRRDLMAALVEYPEAKSVLEDQAKKRMKTNLQAQRAFSVDTLLRSSQEQSSMDSGVVKDEIIGQDVSEIKAMIEELKNANKVPGRSVWQMIAKCEVLQAKLSEKEKEVEDSKNRIRDLESLLYSRHRPKEEGEEADAELLEEEEDPQSPSPRRNSNNVTRQYSQDEGRPSTFQCLPRKQVPDLKVTPSSEPSSSDESTSFIKTSKLTNIFEKPSKDVRVHRSSDAVVEDVNDNFDDAWNCNYTNETSIDHEFLFHDQQISVTTSFRDEFHLGDSLDLNVHTIPEESEDECVDTMAELGNKKLISSYHSDNVTAVADKGHWSYADNDTDIGSEDVIGRRYTNIETDIGSDGMIGRRYTNIETYKLDKGLRQSYIETAVADKDLGHQPYNGTDSGDEDLTRRRFTNIETNIRDRDLRHGCLSDTQTDVGNIGKGNQRYADNETDLLDGCMIRRRYTNIENVNQDRGSETKVRDKDLGHRCYTDSETNLGDKGKGHRCYNDSLNVDARPLSFRNHGRVTSTCSSEADVSSVGSLWKRRKELESGLNVSSFTKDSSHGSMKDLPIQPNNGLFVRPSSTTDISDSSLRSLWRRSASADGVNEGFNEIATLDESTRSKDSGFRSMFDRLSSSNSVDRPDSRSSWKRSTSSNTNIDRPITPDEDPKDKYSGLKYVWNKLSLTNGADKDTDASTTSGGSSMYKSCPSDRGTNSLDASRYRSCPSDQSTITLDERDASRYRSCPSDQGTTTLDDRDASRYRSCPSDRDKTTADEHTSSKLVPEVDESSKIEKGQSSTQEIKRLLDGQASKSFKCVNGMDFLRMTSMRSLQSDNNSSSKSSRRSSWAYDSDEDKSEEDDYDSG